MPGLRRGRHTLHPDVLRTSLEIPPSGVSLAFSLGPGLPVALTCVPHQAVGVRSSVFDSESRCKNSGQPPTARRIGLNVGTGQVRAPCGKSWTGSRVGTTYCDKLVSIPGDTDPRAVGPCSVSRPDHPSGPVRIVPSLPTATKRSPFHEKPERNAVVREIRSRQRILFGLVRIVPSPPTATNWPPSDATLAKSICLRTPPRPRLDSWSTAATRSGADRSSSIVCAVLARSCRSSGQSGSCSRSILPDNARASSRRCRRPGWGRG